MQIVENETDMVVVKTRIIVDVEWDGISPMCGLVEVPDGVPLQVSMYASACIAAVVLSHLPDDSENVLDYIRKQAITINTSFRSHDEQANRTSGR